MTTAKHTKQDLLIFYLITFIFFFFPSFANILLKSLQEKENERRCNLISFHWLNFLKHLKNVFFFGNGFIHLYFAKRKSRSSRDETHSGCKGKTQLKKS